MENNKKELDELEESIRQGTAIAGGGYDPSTQRVQRGMGTIKTALVQGTAPDPATVLRLLREVADTIPDGSRGATAPSVRNSQPYQRREQYPPP